MVIADFVIVRKDDGGIGIFTIGFNDFFGVSLIIRIILMGDSNEGGFASMNGEVKITTDVCVLIGDDFEVVFFGEFFDVLIGSSSSYDNLT